MQLFYVILPIVDCGLFAVPAWNKNIVQKRNIQLGEEVKAPLCMVSLRFRVLDSEGVVGSQNKGNKSINYAQILKGF